MTFVPIKGSELVARAMAFVDDGGRYKLGGGARFADPSPFGPTKNRFPGRCDCSGFTAWAATYDREGRWNTNGIVADAKKKGPQERFAVVPSTKPIRAGDFIVRPGVDEDHDGLPDPGTHGHMGIIVEVLDGFDRLAYGWWLDLRVAHCLPRRKRPGAIRVTDASMWMERGYLIRPHHVRAG